MDIPWGAHYLYSINRGSAEWAFLLEPDMLTTFISILLFGLNSIQGKKRDERIIGEMKRGIDEIKKEIRKLNVDPDQVETFLSSGKYTVVFKNFDDFDPSSIMFVHEFNSFAPLNEYRTKPDGCIQSHI